MLLGGLRIFPRAFDNISLSKIEGEGEGGWGKQSELWGNGK